MSAHRLITSWAFLALIAGCDAGSPRLQGTWIGERADGMPSDQQVQANTFVTSTKITFHRNVVTIETAGQSSKGRYRVLSDSGSTVVVAAPSDPDPQTFERVGERRLKWILADGRAMLFMKQDR